MALFVVAFLIRKRHHVWRWVAFGLGFVFVLLTVGAGVNAHYAYFPTLGALWGDIGSKKVSVDDLKPLPQAAPGDTSKPKGCDEIPTQGSMTNVAVPGTKSGMKPPDLWIYLPPSWCTNDDTKYPVLFLIHGTPSPGGAYDWFTAMEANKAADAFAAAHGGKTPVLIVPDVGSPNDTECVDSAKFGNIETYITQDVVSWVKSFDVFSGRIQTDPKGWGISGFSMGGMCSFMLTLRHPDIWNTFGNFGGDLFGVDDNTTEAQQRIDTARDLFGGNGQTFDEHDPTKIMQGKKFPELAGWFNVGANDKGTLKDIATYYDQATAAGITTCWSVTPDQDHTFFAWKPAFAETLPWFSARLGLIPTTPEITAMCKKR